MGVGVGSAEATLEACRLREFLVTLNFNEIDSLRFDMLHRQWCRAVINFLEEGGVSNVTFGRAAKLIAVYLKTVAVLGPGFRTAFASIAHPPIDAILLRKLAASDVNSAYKSKWAKIKWTKLNEVQYYELILELRQALAVDEPFWMLERYWTVTNDSEL